MAWAESRRTRTRTRARTLSLSLALSRYALSGAGGDKGAAPPFSFLNLGILAYVGKSEALVQIAVGGDASDRKVKGAGRAGFALWRSVYLSKQYGLRNRLLVAVDWAKARVFGRDLSRF